jgi:uncharacterized protein YaiE (UPF0345 family)
MQLEVRQVKDVAEFTGGVMAIGQYFGMTANEERMTRFSELLTLERMHAAWNDRRRGRRLRLQPHRSRR